MKTSYQSEGSSESKHEQTSNEQAVAKLPVVAAANGNGGPKARFERFFSKDDEINFLQAMLDFKANENPELDEFDIIKNALEVDVTVKQVANKKKKLKARYFSNAAKVRDGCALKFQDAKDRTLFTLSGRVWEAEFLRAQKTKESSNEGVQLKDSGNTNKVSRLDMSLNLDSFLTKEQLQNVDKKRKRRLEKKMKMAKIAEYEVLGLKHDYEADKAWLIIDALKADL